MAKFLIIRFSSIGDIVLTTPVIRCLKTQLSDSEIHFATKPAYLPVIENNPHITKVHLLNSDLNSYVNQLKSEQFDYIIDLHNNIRTAYIKTLLGVKSFSFDKLNFQKWLMVQFKINRLPHKHIVDRYISTVSEFNVNNDGMGLDYFLPVSQDDLFNDKFRGTIFENLISSKYIAFVIGANHSTKRLPVSKIISICKKIPQKVVLLGGHGDQERSLEITNASGSHVLNACGKFTLHESAYVLKHAEHVITHDTGLMHIAAAFGKPITSVWGNTIPQFGMTPYFGIAKNYSTLVEVAGLNCRPCSKIGFAKCPKNHFKCMTMINEEAIIKSIMDKTEYLS